MKKIIVLGFALLLTAHLQAQFIVNDGITLTNTTDVSTNGDWVNDGSFTNNGTLWLKDSWTNLGTYEAAGTGRIVVDVNSPKNFNHNGQSVATFVKMGFGTLTLIGNVSIADSLMILDGLLNNATDTLLFSSDAYIQHAQNAYATGKVTHVGGGTKYFPVGSGSNALPVTVTNISGAAPKVTASMVPFPGGYSAGAGVDSLINFPVAWRIDASAQTDTASFLKFQFPQSIVFVPDWNVAVAVRDNGNNEFEGMGRRGVLENMGGIRTLTSYSKGLRGLFSVAAGFTGNLATDSLALVTFYNNTGATAWTKDTNWLTGNVGTWQGVTETGGTITSLVLDNANIRGAMNAEIADIQSLVTVNVASNNITAIPDFTTLTALTSLNVSDNSLDFSSLESNASLGTVINYANQKPIDLLLGDSVLVDAGTDYELVASVAGSQNSYAVKRNGTEVSNSTGDTYLISSINRTNMGEYEVAVTNALVPNLTLSTLPVTILAVADISGHMLIDATTPATSGTMDLFRITASGAYDTTQNISISNDGSYLFEKVVLDDYIVLCKPSSALYPTAIPTYYSNTIFWEEATPVELNTSIADLDIIAQFIASNVPVGVGSLAGFLQEDDGTGGRTQKNSRVGGSGVTARRAQGTGRGEEVTYEVIAYTETDENGEFDMQQLPTGDYRLNIQYPGFPMDETSFVEFTISTNPLEKDVQIEATVVDNKITVRELVITGLFETASYKVNVYPNPTIESIHFDFENASAQREVILLDAQGKAVKQQTASEKSSSMMVKDFAKGIYHIQVLDKNKVKKVVRLVIE